MDEKENHALVPYMIEEYLTKKEPLKSLLTERLKDPPEEVTNDLLNQFPKANFLATLLGILTSQLKTSSPFDALHFADKATQLSVEGHFDPHAPVTFLHYVFSFATMDDLVANLEAIRKRVSAIPRTPLLQLYFIKLFQSAIERDMHGLNAVRSGCFRLLLAESLRASHPSAVNRRGTYTIHPIAYNALPQNSVEWAL
ncbi:hypothetical protein BWQ96_06516 [Gracilariopsis chorda]|uniref:Uncharacterized protein n=1 Tax=Gracilariopsis chorda TaxID=448386 RepID=A0A2V3INV9_9FLOR|nr:hypothetical protein BWQ96_06516 [Gracilariopsis chorda]|eukprot:PXF43739.1 hypothetical protein BWQ96_06516 [Gracilariopsis chorda]